MIPRTSDWAALYDREVSVLRAPAPYEHFGGHRVVVREPKLPGMLAELHMLGTSSWIGVLSDLDGLWHFRDISQRASDPYDSQAFAGDVEQVTRELGELLIAKNAAYGDSALNPLRVFSRASAIEQLHVRIDDKLSRLKRGDAAGEDVILDLLGYLILLRIAQRRAAP